MAQPNHSKSPLKKSNTRTSNRNADNNNVHARKQQRAAHRSMTLSALLDHIIHTRNIRHKRSTGRAVCAETPSSRWTCTSIPAPGHADVPPLLQMDYFSLVLRRLMGIDVRLECALSMLGAFA